jgi:Acetyltransferase (GNAT) domain
MRLLRPVEIVEPQLADAKDLVSHGAGHSRCSSGKLAVQIVDPLADPSWDQEVKSNSMSSVFHTTAWAKVLIKTYRHRPFYLHFCRGTETVALVPMMEVASFFTGRRGVSLPFTDFCKPLLFDHPPAGEEFFEIILELARSQKWRYIEVRGGRELFSPSANTGERYYDHTLDLTIGIEKLFAQLLSRCRNAIRRAEKSELTVHTDSTLEAVRAFYRLHIRTRRRQGLPPQPFEFFRNIHEEIIQRDLGFVLVVKSAQTIIAAAVFLHSGEEAVYKFAASDRRFQALRGNNLAVWEGIKFLARNGVKKLRFGRTPLGNEGLRQFKLSWGTVEETIEYFRFALQTQAWEVNHRGGSGLFSQLFGRLPLAVNRFAGALIYPHID